MIADAVTDCERRMDPVELGGAEVREVARVMAAPSGFLLTVPVLQAVIERHAKEARQMVADAYFTLNSISHWSARLSERLAAEGRLCLADVVSHLSTLGREEVLGAVERGWLETLPTARSWDPERAWGRFSTGRIVDALDGELRAICLGLIFTMDLVPDSWRPPLCRSVGHLMLTTADIEEEAAKIFQTQAD